MISTELSTRECGDCLVVTLRGELDLIDAPFVAAALKALADRDPMVVVDLAGLDFIDCSGVTALAYGQRQARHGGGDLLLAAPQRQVMRLLASTAPHHGLCVYATAEGAVSGLIGGAGRSHGPFIRKFLNLG